MKQFFALALLALLGFSSYSQYNINPQAIDIVRDSFGVPHIFAKTDAEVCYGLAWATCEDDFATMQFLLLAAKAMLGRNLGIEGAKIDYAVQLMGVREYVDANYETGVPNDIKKLLSYYTVAANKYAEMHPEEVLVKKSFPVTEKDIVCGYMLGLALMSGVEGSINHIINMNAWKERQPTEPITKGSNAFAFNSNKTTDGNTFLAINSHQPLEGPMSWYEAHLCSEEGWNIVGSLFHGGISVFHGTNEYLGWAHTTNVDMDIKDMWELEMHPRKKNYYRVDNNWHKLEKGKAKLVVALGKKKKFKLPVFKATYNSIYGPVVKTDSGYAAFNLPAIRNLQAVEEWYRMNKAKNFSEFKKIIDMNSIAMQNIIYADKFDTIYKVSNCILPIREKGYDWTKMVPGNTSKTLWKGFYGMDDLPHALNPKCGWVFNCNNSSLELTAKDENPKLEDFNPDMGWNYEETSRSLRFYELMEDVYPDKINFDEFFTIKYDNQWPKHMAFLRKYDIDDFFTLNADSFPEKIREGIKIISHWNKKADLENTDCAFVFDCLYNIYNNSGGNKEQLFQTDVKAKKDFYGTQIEKSMTTFMRVFGTLSPPLSDYQLLQRGDKKVPIDGGPDMLRAVYSHQQSDGRVKPWVGDSYIQLVKFTKNGPEIQSINVYGASNKANSMHYTDQMQDFCDHKLKKMSLNKQEVYRHAAQIYHPQ